MSGQNAVSGLAIPGSGARAAGAGVSQLSASLLEHSDSLLASITVPAENISTSPFAGAFNKMPTGKKTLLVLNASSWIGQAHLGAVSQLALEADAALKVMSPTADPKFSPWNNTGTEEGAVKEGGFYVGSGAQTPAPIATEQVQGPPIGSLGASPSVSFLSGMGLPRKSSAVWQPATEADLSAGGKLRVVAAYRSAAKIPNTLPPGIDKFVQVDFDNPASLDAAFAQESVDYVYIIPSYTQNRVKQTNEIVQACLRHRRVRYLVLLSLLSPKPAGFTGRAAPQEHEFPIQNEFRDLEKTVAKSGIPHTFVRVGLFHHQLFEIAKRAAEWTVENAPEDADVVPIGLPLKTGSVAPVDVRDVALVTSHLFATFPQHGFVNRPIDITGPQLLSGTALVGAMSRGLGKPMRFANISTVDFAQFLTRVGLAGTVRDVEAICALWATAGKGEWAYTGVDISEIIATPEGGKKRRGIPLYQHFEERKEEILSLFTELAESNKNSSPSSPTRAGAELRRSNSLLGGNAAGIISTHARRPSIPSPLLGDLSLGSSVDKKPTPPPNPSAQDLPTPSAPTTTWWQPSKVENKIGVQMTPADWLKRYGPGALSSPQKSTHIPGGDKKDAFFHGFVEADQNTGAAELRGVAEGAVAKK